MTAVAIGYDPAVTSSEVRRIREALGLTQDEFAERLGTHRVTVAKWEAGMRSPRGTAVTLIRLLASTAPRRAPSKRTSGRRKSRRPK